MRLLKTAITRNGQLEAVEYEGQKRPSYAILSHTWGNEEVLLADLEHPKRMRRKKGHRKIVSMLKQAAKDGLSFAWVDTCCIDKRSSAELSEAINSMYRWYADAAACYAFIEDVCQIKDDDWRQSFRSCRWFMRGWTLQELLAPQGVIFFDCDWELMGHKRFDLTEEIERATGISQAFLTGERRVQTASIARRMSWAARRSTTREEDVAYSLFGIFDVALPMLYGEGRKAFIRLQEEIMRNSDDETIFAWKNPPSCAQGLDLGGVRSGLLADSPLAFADTGDMVPFVFSTVRGKNAHQVTNRGVQATFATACSRDTASGPGGSMLAILECASDTMPSYVAVVLVQSGESPLHYA